MERTERTYYFLAAYFGLPPCESVPTTDRKRKRVLPVEPLELPPGPAAETGRPEKKQKITFCEECQREFYTTSNYGRRLAGPLHNDVRYFCSFPGCRKSYGRNSVREKHEKEKHGRVNYEREAYRSALVW